MKVLAKMIALSMVLNIVFNSNAAGGAEKNIRKKKIMLTTISPDYLKNLKEMYLTKHNKLQAQLAKKASEETSDKKSLHEDIDSITINMKNVMETISFINKIENMNMKKLKKEKMSLQGKINKVQTLIKKAKSVDLMNEKQKQKFLLVRRNLDNLLLHMRILIAEMLNMKMLRKKKTK